MPERFVNLLPYTSQRQILKEEDGAVFYHEGTTYPRASGYQREEDSRIGKAVFYDGDTGEWHGEGKRMGKRGDQVDDKNGMR